MNHEAEGECDHLDAEIQHNISQIRTLFSQHFLFNEENKIKGNANKNNNPSDLSAERLD